MSLYGVPNSGLISSCHSFVACLKGSRPSIFSVPPSPAPGPSGAVPVDTGTAPVPTGLDHAALTSIVLGVAARGAGTLTSSMPFADFASTWATSTPSRSEEHTSELQSQSNLVCRLLLD